MNAFLKRLREPSTYAGLAAIFAALAPIFGVPSEVVHGGVAALGGVAVVVGESGAS
ncbi:MAG: hypothetical protein NVS9B2_27880 [Steroidobacteraceae bacterium]